MRCSVSRLGALAAAVVLGWLALTVGPTSARAASGSVTVTHLLDSLGASTIEVPAGAKPMANGRNFQPFWFTEAPKAMEPWHRRVLIYNGGAKFRDMREALVVPVGTKLTIPASVASGDRFFGIPLVQGAAGKNVVVKVLCKSGATEKVVWESKVASGQVGSLKSWPSGIEASVTSACSQIVLLSSYENTKQNGCYMVWQDPRIEKTRGADAPPYNVVMIVVDALRGDAVGAARSNFATVSPNIDALAKGGTDFVWGHSAANTTLMSMNVLLTGAHARAGNFIALWWNKKDRRPDFYHSKPTYVTRILHKAGFVTMCAVNNHLYFADYIYGVDPGFDIVQDCQKDREDHPLLTKSVIDFMKQNQQKRFFVQLNLLGPHQPYNPPEECVAVARKALKGADPMYDARYIGEICWVDKHVGMVMEALKKEGLDKNTIVVLTADHGEVMDGRHQCRSESQQQSCAKLHGLTLYNEEIHVPMIFSLPGVIRPQVVATPVSHPDIVPTLLAMNKLEVPGRMSGRSLVATLLQGSALPEIPVYAERWNARALRWGKWKLIWHTPKDDICPRSVQKTCKKGGSWVELYDVSTDPNERNDVSVTQAAKVKEMKAKIEAIKDELYLKSGGQGPNP